MQKLFYILCIILIPTWALSFNLSVTATSGDSWSSGVYSVSVGDSVSFACTPSGGTGPYTYSWNFDDLDTYKNGVSTSQNPSHTFDYLGLHKVWVTVTDTGAGNATEKAVLLIDVKISSSENRVDVTSADDVGAGNVLYNDGTNATANSSRIATIISTYHDGTNGLTLYFPSGTYDFEDSGNVSGRYYAISIPDDSKIIFEGDRSNPPTLAFANRATYGSQSSDFWVNRTNATDTGYLMFRRMTLDWDGTHAVSEVANQGVMRDINDNYLFKTTVEEVTITDYSMPVFSWGNCIVRRSNLSGFGRFDGWASNQGFTQAIDHADNALDRQLYVADGYSGCFNTSQGERCGHSKLWYAQRFQYLYIIECYGDGDNAEDSQDFLVYKDSSQDSTIEGNLFLNSKATFLQLGSYDDQADDITMRDNRLITSDSQATILIYSSLTDILADGNFTVSNSSSFLKAGDSSKCASGLDANGITYQNNVGGYGDDTPSGSCNYDCGGNPGCDITNGGGNSSTSNKYKVGDPAGWYDDSGYKDPGVFEFVTPTNNGSSASDSGSGVGASARFPFQEGAMAQGHDGSNNFSEIELYADRSNLNTWSEIRYADVDHNWSGLESFSTEGTISGMNIQ